MPKAWKDMVSSIRKNLSGKTNPRTKKNYTESEIYAIAMAQYKKKYGHAPKREHVFDFIKEDGSILLEYSVPIKAGLIEEKMTITGIAVDATVSRNKIRYTPEELKKAAKSLIGKPILNAHKSDDIFNILGKVTDAYFDESKESIPFSAEIMDEKAQKYVNDGRVDSVSIGAKVDSLIEDTDESGILTAIGIDFMELSLVPIKGVKNATIHQAISEKYSFIDEVNKKFNELQIEENKGEPIMEKDELRQIVKEEFISLMNTVKEEDAKIQAETKATEETETLKKEIEALKEQVKLLKEQEKPAEEEPEEPVAEPQAEVGKPEEAPEETVSDIIIEKYRDGVSIWRMPKNPRVN